MAGNKNLNSAKTARKDEFYTQLTDIEKEMRYYRKHFKDKVVLCNCDDPFESNFFKYFVLNFNRLGLKKLIATCYTGSPIANKQLSIFDILGETEENQNKPYKAVVTTVYDKTGDGSVDMLDVAELFKSGENELTELKGDGDFRSSECLELLDEADIVVTNPPFSLFREYLGTLVEHKKHFIIIGNVNAVKYGEVFPLFMSNDLWLGASIHSGDRAFFVPDDYPLDAAGCGVDEETGRKFIRVKGVRWFTNLDIKQRHEKLILVKRYTPEEYPKYVNYDAIEVAKTSDIPCDYAGEMGVPITFMDKYNPDQFEIIGMNWTVLSDSTFLGYTKEKGDTELTIVPKEADIVRRIFRDFLEGCSIGEIKGMLEASGVKTPAGKDTWYHSTIISMLKNEKYMGDLLLQKTYTVDFLTKEKAKNCGEFPQYYVENAHPPIVPKEVFMRVQGELMRREQGKESGSGRPTLHLALNGKIQCGCCGSAYRRCSSPWEETVWRCRHLGRKKYCTGRAVKEKAVKEAVAEAFCRLPGCREDLIRMQERIQWGPLETISRELAAIEGRKAALEGIISGYAAAGTLDRRTIFLYTDEFEEEVSAETAIEHIRNELDDLFWSW